MRLYTTARKPTDSVTHRFLPAARALGCRATICTDRPEWYADGEHKALGRDVRVPRASIDAIAQPDAAFTGSGRIQAETALAAACSGLPGKTWRARLIAKNKALTRRRADTGMEHVRSLRPALGDPVEAG